MNLLSKFIYMLNLDNKNILIILSIIAIILFLFRQTENMVQVVYGKRVATKNKKKLSNDEKASKIKKNLAKIKMSDLKNENAVVLRKAILKIKKKMKNIEKNNNINKSKLLKNKAEICGPIIKKEVNEAKIKTAGKYERLCKCGDHLDTYVKNKIREAIEEVTETNTI